MLVSELLVTNYPVVSPADQAEHVLQLMEDFEISHLPVVKDDQFMGLISKEILEEYDQEAVVSDMENALIHCMVHTGDHFLMALKLAASFDISLLAVTDKQNIFQGVITHKELILAASSFSGANEPGAMIVLEMDKHIYSFGEISRLVETNDAYITQANTSINNITGNIQITLKISKPEISDIIATFLRYEYNVKYYFGAQTYEDTLKENYDLLMTYLSI